MAMMILVYSLKDDSEKVKAIQKATLTTTDSGLEPEPALFGTDEWWTAIETGMLETHQLDGVVSTVIWGSMGDWPVVEVVDKNGNKTRWTRERQARRFVDGLTIRIRHVLQRHRGMGPTEERPIVLEMWLEDSPRRSEGPLGPQGVLDRKSNRALEVEPEG